MKHVNQLNGLFLACNGKRYVASKLWAKSEAQSLLTAACLLLVRRGITLFHAYGQLTLLI
jgi:hypothetical protein